MRPLAFTLLLTAAALAWAAAAPTTATGAPAPGPVDLGPVEILVEDVLGPTTPGEVGVLDLHVVPPDRTLVITDTQALAFGVPAGARRPGHDVVVSPITPPPEALRTQIAAGIAFGPGSRVQLELPAEYEGTFPSLRGRYEDAFPRLKTITAP